MTSGTCPLPYGPACALGGGLSKADVEGSVVCVSTGAETVVWVGGWVRAVLVMEEWNEHTHNCGLMLVVLDVVWKWARRALLC